MKRSLVMFVSLIWSLTALAGDPEARFLAAADAYDREAHDEAIAEYERLLADGHRAAELYFNLANAYYRVGDYGTAILHYKQAEQLAPRDRDIRHNLRFALLQADAAYAPPSLPVRWLRSLSFAEWAVIASIAWWLATLYLCLALWPAARRGWGVTATLTVAVFLVSLAGVQQWTALRTRPEVVVTRSGQEALFAPIDGTTAHFALPPGSIARVNAHIEGWYEIRVGEQDGWIRQAAVTRVAPLD